MGRKAAKAKEKKLRKKEENIKLKAAQQKVDVANKQEDPLSQLKPFQIFNRNGLNLNISCSRYKGLDKETQDWTFEITKKNMEDLYKESDWGWDDTTKKNEMSEDAAWYLIVRDAETNTPVGCVHFRFDIDCDDEVLYCYEVQLDSSVQRKGLGKFLMQILELLAHRNQMIKIMVTIFKHNPQAVNFFITKLRYTLDETSPVEHVLDTVFAEKEELQSYQILSKPIPQREVKPSKPVPLATNVPLTAAT